MPLQRLASVDATLAWLAQSGVRALATDSRRVKAGDAFIAWPGHAVDGRGYVGAAIAAGAHACLVEADGVEVFDFDALGAQATVAALPGLKQRTGQIASAFMGRPSERLPVLAITGTNGKTSTAWWAAQALGALGRRCGVIGTLGVGEPPSTQRPEASVQATGLTTPDPVTLQAALRQFADAGFAACAIEASSIGIVEHRLAGTHIAVALFTNFTQDHLDYHGSMTAYWQAKAELFNWPGLRAAVINVDDEQGAALAASLRHRDLDVWTYSTRGPARLVARAVAYRQGGLGFEVHEGDHAVPVETTLIGDYNAANLLAVIGGLRALGLPLVDIARVCGQLTSVPGRMQRVGAAGADVAGADVAGGPIVVVDYAHTPDALEKALLALRPFAAERGGRLWCVFGCGGNRDAGKRPRMGAIAQRLADQVLLTSDNPRNESPAFILLQIVAGLPGTQERVTVVEDRRAAIRHAVRGAAAHDVVLIAGKGHEDYQEIAGVKHPFSDVAEAQAELGRRP